MPAAQHKGNGGGLHPGGKPRFYVAAYGVQNHQKPPNLRILLNGHQLGDDVLIFRSLILRGKNVVPLHLADDGQAVDLVPPSRGNGSGGGDKPGLLFGRGKLLFLRKILFRHA